ncbi:MAG: DUF4442 domain-containing protein [Nitrospirota bacterium]|nr:DUF4442 domain-containing protein [Nitrospirota bacterium]
MSESLKSRMERWVLNLWPCYRGSGGRISYVRHDYTRVRVRIPLTWRTRNYVGSIYGGSMYGAIDPIYMMMLIRILGPDYTVLDKAADVRFKKMGKTTLWADFHLTEDELQTIRDTLQTQEKLDREYMVELKDADGVVHTQINKVIHIRKRKRNGAPAPG